MIAVTPPALPRDLRGPALRWYGDIPLSTPVGLTIQELRRKRAIGDAHLTDHVGLTGKQDAASPHVVMHLDEQVGELACTPEHSGNDDETNRITDQHTDTDAPGRPVHPPVHKLPYGQQQDNDGADAEDQSRDMKAGLGLHIFFADSHAREMWPTRTGWNHPRSSPLQCSLGHVTPPNELYRPIATALDLRAFA